MVNQQSLVDEWAENCNKIMEYAMSLTPGPSKGARPVGVAIGRVLYWMRAPYRLVEKAGWWLEDVIEIAREEAYRDER